MEPSSPAYTNPSRAAERPWSLRMADSMLARHRPLLSRRWHYEPGVALLALKGAWSRTREKAYYDAIKRNIDEFVAPDGGIRTYRLEDYNLDQINEGKLLFSLYETTGDDRYRRAAHLLRRQLETQPRTNAGGFWHKKIYPYQMWLDGIYMASPFYAEFARRFDEPEAFDDVAHQITVIARHTRDDASGLLYHAWDESGRQEWAHPETGWSPHFWGRAMAWYAMALVDVLDYFPEDHPRRDELIGILEGVASAAARVQDPSSGVWYQVLDQGTRPGNYLESSASCMFVYAIAKGVRQGHLGREHLATATRGYQGILTQFVTVEQGGLVNLDGICAVAGLGGKPYRDGSYEYYVGEPVIRNEFKGVGPFIMASIEMESLG